MIKRREFCKYCSQPITFGNAKRQFCSNKCKIYYGRELSRGTLIKVEETKKIGGVSVPPPENYQPENIGYSQKTQPLVVQVDPCIITKKTTYEDLKKLCPYLSGIERSMWLNEYKEYLKK